MSAVLIISIVLLFAVSFVIYRTKRKSFNGIPQQEYFPLPPRGLFSDGARAGDAVVAEKAADTSNDLSIGIIKRAEAGELEALVGASKVRDARLYDDALSALVKREPSEENVRAISSFIIGREGLRANRMLAEEALKVWRSAPESLPATDLLRVAALSDDAHLFGEVVEELVAASEGGRLAVKTVSDLRVLLGSEYWVLSPEATHKSSGFILKQKLAEAGRRLAAVSRRQTTPNGPGEA